MPRLLPSAHRSSFCSTVLCALLCLGSGLLCWTPDSLHAADAPMFRNDPQHSGIYASASPSLQKVRWRFKTGAEVLSSPAVVGDSVYVGSADHFLYALNRSDGTVRWKFETEGPVNSSPAVVAGTVFISSVDGNVYAVNAADGTLKWKFATGGERRFSAPGIHGAIPRTEVMPDPFDVFLSSPTVVGGTLFIGSGDHFVYALDAGTGALKWKFQTGNVVHASPAVADGVLYIGSWDRYLYALKASDGSLIWKFQTGDDTDIYNQVGIASSASVADGMVFFGCRDGHFYAVDAKTGTQRWSVDNHHGWVIASPAVSNGVVYFPTSDGKRFKAVQAATGQVVFDIKNKAISFSSPAVTADRVFFGSSEGWLRALDPHSGKVLVELASDGARQNLPAYLKPDGEVNFQALYPDRTLDGLIIGIHRMFTVGSFLSSPSIVDGVLYVGSGDGQVYAIE